MDVKKYNIKDLTLAYFNKKSQIYRSGGYKQARVLTRDKEDYINHFFAFLIDINICLLPVYIWVIEFLLILCGLISPHFFDLLFYIMYGCLFVVAVLLLGLFTARSKGQSFGYVLTDLKLVRRDKREAMALNLIMRQALGIGIPLMILGYFFGTLGILAWWLLNGIIVLITPNQQSLFDLVFGLVTVNEPEINITFDNKKPEPKVQHDICPIDLHIRSNYSDDGYYDVEEIFKQAKQLKMEVISITDHNCARANAAATRFAELYGIQYIPGVELDAQYNGTRVRVLGYYIDWTKDIFEILESDSLLREKECSIQRVKKFEEFSGISIDVDSIISNSRFQTITATDITKMVFNNERVRSMSFVKRYIDQSSTQSEAMARFKRDLFGKGGPCYVKGNYPELDSAIEAIHQAGGIAILSSWQLDNISDEMIERMISLGIDGVEVFSPNVHDETIAAVLKIVQKYKLLVSCGSDYHGPTKPNRRLGETNCPEKGLALVKILTKAAKKD